jgi:potassium efflux system protein
MRDLRRGLIGLALAASWPAYLAMAALVARLGPWPRDLVAPLFVTGLGLAAATFLTSAGRMLFRNDGWAEEVLGMPRAATRQARRVVLALAIAGFVLLVPERIVADGLIAPGGRPIAAQALGRMLVLGFELTGAIVMARLLRPRSPLLEWLKDESSRAGWVGRHCRSLAALTLLGIGLVLTLDAAGYRYTARRLALGGVWSVGLAAACWGAHRVLMGLIARHGWRWNMLMRETAAAAAAPEGGAETPAEDASAKLRTLVHVVSACLGILGAAWVWNVDLALFRYIGEQRLWTVGETPVLVGDFATMCVVVFLTIFAWRYLNTFFTVAIFPRMPDDPGIRFAVATLCRYVVLAIGLIAGLSSVHLGIEKIGVVLAALGVGLGFGLQEIVSNFVSGIILLLERPIRVGDLVTVANMTGTIDQINIRATTIVNGDNQSMIVPNREFITSSLINWTHKDRVVRLTIHVNVAIGADADKVSDLLLAIAHDDPDVLNNPVPAAWIDAFGDSTQNFLLYLFVPDPSLLARVRHRVYAEIQKRFDAAGIVIPLPIRELRVHAMPNPTDVEYIPRPHFNPETRKGMNVSKLSPTARAATLPEPVEDCHRGVDE